MVSRQAGHFFFEPKGYDQVNQATHEHKEDIKVGYNLRRKVVLLSIWALSPLVLWLDPTLFGMFAPHADGATSCGTSAQIWLVVGLGGLLFRTVQLFFMQGRADRPGVGHEDPHRSVPRHHAVLRAPLYLLRGELIDPMRATSASGPEAVSCRTRRLIALLVSAASAHHQPSPLHGLRPPPRSGRRLRRSPRRCSRG